MTRAILKPIRSEADYSAAVARIEEIIDAAPGTPEADELEILVTLVERFEEASFPVEAPTPLAAIRFRMEQQNLTPRDLEPYIGTRARVSEVLNGTRSLSIDMIRALHEHLGIPAEVLLGKNEISENFAGLELSKPAAKALIRLNIMKPMETLAAFLARVCGPTPALAMLRKTRTARTNVTTDLAALQAWCAAAMLRSYEIKLARDFDPNCFGDDAIRSLAKLSVNEHGPRLAREKLATFGIPLVVLPHLPGTHLDGAAMHRPDGVPVVALTLRRDRIDNFWFTLIHECVHVSKHLAGRTVILDDLEIGSTEEIEQEADREAAEALVPAKLWASFRDGTYTSMADVLELAERASVHPAIVAGRWQMRNRDFRKFSKLLGHGQVRHEFPDFPNP
jgi:HTH-type transcriptional regulator/antitoxin HigA